MKNHLVVFLVAPLVPGLLLAGCGGGGGSDAGTVFPDTPAVSFDCVHKSSLDKDYEVGPGQAYPNLGAVPWETLGPGDSVRIHFTPGGYHEKFLISTRGTEADPIVVCGIPQTTDGVTHLPIIDGQYATTRTQLVYGPNSGIEGTSLVAIYNNGAASPGGKRPGYIKIANLQIQGAQGANSYTSAAGVKVPYAKIGPAAVNIFGADNVSLIGNVITDSDEGLFVNSKDYTAADGYDYAQSRDIWVQGNTFENNGIPGNYYVHHAYTEAIGIVYEYNYFGRLKDYAQGNAIADRSVGTLVRYNYIDGGAHLAAFENPQASWKNVQANLAKDASLRRTFVYGNVFVDRHNPGVTTGNNDSPDKYNGYASKLFLYGGTDQNYDSYRNGTLYFYNNTVVVQADAAKEYNTTLFEVYASPDDPLAAKVDVRNNVFCFGAETAGGMSTQFFLEASSNTTFGPGNMGIGDLTFEANWINHGWQPTIPATPPYYDPSSASIKTTGFLEGSPGTDPGFADLARYDLHLKAGSPAIDKGIALDPVAADTYDVSFEYVGPNSGEDRDLHGTKIDLGAFEGP